MENSMKLLLIFCVIFAISCKKPQTEAQLLEQQRIEILSLINEPTITDDVLKKLNTKLVGKSRTYVKKLIGDGFECPFEQPKEYPTGLSDERKREIDIAAIGYSNIKIYYNLLNEVSWVSRIYSTE